MTPTLHSHTHCQVAQANPQTKTWQRVCLSHSTTNRQSERKTEGQQLTAVLRNGGCSASYDSFLVGSSAVLRLNFCAENPPLRKAAKPLPPMLKDRRTDNETTGKSPLTFSTFAFAPTLKADPSAKLKELNFATAQTSIWTLKSILSDINRQVGNYESKRITDK